MFDFFYGSDSEQYQFYRVPQVAYLVYETTESQNISE